MPKLLSEILLLEPGGEIRIGDGAPGINFTGIRIYKTMSGFGFETYDQDVLQLYIDSHGVLHRAVEGETSQSQSEILPSSDLLGGDNDWTGINTFLKALLLADAAILGSKDFLSDLTTGKGVRVWQDSNGKWHLELDRIDVRGSMVVSELLFSQVRATNGSLWVSSTGKVKNLLKQH